MDRTAFLQSLSFLLPLSSGEDAIPAVLSELESHKDCEEEPLITSDDSYFVSIEPVVRVEAADTSKGSDKNNNTDQNIHNDNDNTQDDDATVDPSQQKGHGDDEGVQKVKSVVSLDPAYFQSSSEDSDPAMCPFQMNVYKAKLVEDANLTTPVRDHRGNAVSLFGGLLDDRDKENKPTNEAVVIVGVDAQAYQLDINYYRSIIGT